MNMSFYLVVYDIANPKRLRRIAKLMTSFGVRVQKSVFECNLRPVKVKQMIEAVNEIIDPDSDGIRIYSLPAYAVEQTSLLGFGPPTTSVECAIVA